MTTPLYINDEAYQLLEHAAEKWGVTCDDLATSAVLAGLVDTMYRVRGPDGEREVCRPCVERCAFRRHDEGEDWESDTDAGEF